MNRADELVPAMQETDNRKPQALTRNGSAFLDCLRFGTAMVVFLGHITFMHGPEMLGHLAHIAVCLFFVLSGFVIRMVVKTRETTRREFLIDRASRIYSVVLPALAITVVCEALAKSIDPSLILGYRWSQVPLQLVLNSTFMAENWGWDVYPMNNSPFWSLSFECVYYLLFALLYSGFRRKKLWQSKETLLAVLLMIVSGPAIVLLFPTWLAGALLYDVYQWLGRKAYGFKLASLLLALSAGVLVWSRHAVKEFLVGTSLSHRVEWLQNVFLFDLHVSPANAAKTVPWLARFSPSFFLAATIAFVVILWVLLTLDRFVPELSPQLTRLLRWVADSTFALYLLHSPLLFLLKAIFHSRPPEPLLWVCSVVLVCILLSRAFERFKFLLRRWLRRVFPYVG
jgi:peptidoglycan/LPS O-acetylase OafA/YrhL